MAFLGSLLQILSIVMGLGLTIVVALQTSKSEGLSGILAGGGGGGGKVGRERHLEKTSMYLAYGWLAVTAIAAWVRHAAG